MTLLALAAVAAACGATPTTPSTATAVSQFAVSALAPGGTAASNFTIAGTSTVGVTLASVVSAATGEVIPATLSLGIGTPSGSTCTPPATVDVTAAVTAQIARPLAAGTYCVTVTDAGSLTDAATITVRITATTGSTTGNATPATDFFSSELFVHGSVVHTFGIATGGSLSAALATLGGGTDVVRFGLGTWDGAVCRLTTSLDTAAGGTIALTADPGAYCLRIEDIGTLTTPSAFSVSITHP